jgi:hypothetical protein
MTLRAMAAEELDLPPANSLVQNVDDVSRVRFHTLPSLSILKMCEPN